MRLINTTTKVLEDVTFDDPEYAILSHRWREKEIVFFDLSTNRHDMDKMKGWSKFSRCCDVARELGFTYLWMDTCCIDKASSSELSEAINSMFDWYRRAAVCLAYLDDVANDGLVATFSKSEWFKRGWTLQELIAPPSVIFFSVDWEVIGTKTSLAATIAIITRIDEKILLGGNLSEISVAKKMSWASGRRTTRVEDEAYSLMGLFGVHMPTIYGEGRKAFIRLQEEILKVSHDQSIFAWCDLTIFRGTKGQFARQVVTYFLMISIFITDLAASFQTRSKQTFIRVTKVMVSMASKRCRMYLTTKTQLLSARRG